MRHDLISDMMYVMNNAENIGKSTCMVPASELIKKMLMVIKKFGFIGSFEFIDDGKSGAFEIHLIGKINKSRVIKPRFAVKAENFEKWEKRYLPSKDIGILIISTPKGVMSHKEAKEAETGGRLLGYIY